MLSQVFETEWPDDDGVEQMHRVEVDIDYSWTPAACSNWQDEIEVHRLIVTDSTIPRRFWGKIAAYLLRVHEEFLAEWIQDVIDESKV